MVLVHVMSHPHIEVFLVTGGTGADEDLNSLDSTEIYDPANIKPGWVVAGAKLPRAMIGLKATNIDGLVLIFGL